jgi:hypothetical protein
VITIDLPTITPVSSRRINAALTLLDQVTDVDIAEVVDVEHRDSELRTLRRAEREVACGRPHVHCASCGRFKTRPSATCRICGDQPVPLGVTDGDYDRAYGWDS